MSNLRYELQHSVGEQRPDGQADEVREHLREVGFLGERDEEETQEGGQVDDGNSQETVTPYCGHPEGGALKHCVHGKAAELELVSPNLVKAYTQAVNSQIDPRLIKCLSTQQELVRLFPHHKHQFSRQD